jgi:NAD(P)-dependent dehydrogenase (short-subunit alcohol dehydrogenase family)/acyl carrier protein
VKPDADMLRAAFEIAQMMARLKPAGARLWFVTNAAQTIGARDTAASPDAAALWGLAASFALEHAELWGGAIDLDYRDAPDALASAVTAELDSATDEDRVALRGGIRYVARLERYAVSAARPRPVRSDAAYLVTGGLGALGTQVVAWLAAKGARHLIVLTRRSADAAAAQALKRRLPDDVDLRIVRGDVGIRADVQHALDTIRARAMPLAGIFHLAGVLQNGPIQEQRWDDFVAALTGKARGARQLHELTLDEPLDCFVLFSSIAGTIGSAGQSNYAAANAFLDALARHRRAQGLPATSIAWGLWEGDGMAASLSDAALGRLADFGLHAFDARAGLAWLERLIDAADAAPKVMAIDWARFDRSSMGRRDLPLLRNLRGAPMPSESSAAAERARLEAMPEERRQSALLRMVSTELVRALGLPSEHRLDVDRGFFDLGMDSIIAVELHARLEQMFGRSFSSTVAFDHPNARSLTAHIYDL